LKTPCGSRRALSHEPRAHSLELEEPASSEGAVQVVRVDVASGAIEPWKAIVHSMDRFLTDLYLVEGLK
jgi:hypothetical protein